MICLKIWKGYYDTVKALGDYLKGGTYDEKGTPPAYTIPFDKRQSIEKEIAKMMRCSNTHLDNIGLKKKNALWRYDLHDKRTWASSESFKYGDLR